MGAAAGVCGEGVVYNWCDADATRVAAVQSRVTAAKGDYPIIVARWAVGRPLQPPGGQGYATLETPLKYPVQPRELTT